MCTYTLCPRSPYISVTDPRKLYEDFKISKEAKRNSTAGKKVITWYAVASERVREDLFDDDVFEECPVSRCKFVRPEMLEDNPERVVDAIIFPGVAGREKNPPARSSPDQVGVIVISVLLLLLQSLCVCVCVRKLF